MRLITLAMLAGFSGRAHTGVRRGVERGQRLHRSSGSSRPRPAESASPCRSTRTSRPAFWRPLPKVEPRTESSRNPIPDQARRRAGRVDAGSRPTRHYAWFWDEVPTAASPTYRGASTWRWPRCRQGPGGTIGARATHAAHAGDRRQIRHRDPEGDAGHRGFAGAGAGGDRHRKRGAGGCGQLVRGAVGLMQLIPATAERFGVSDSTDPVQNIKGGVAYLDWLMKRVRQRSADGACRLQRGRGGGTQQRRRAPLCRDAGLCAQGAGRLAGGAGPVPQPAGAGDGSLRVQGAWR